MHIIDACQIDYSSATTLELNFLLLNCILSTYYKNFIIKHILHYVYTFEFDWT